MFRTPTIFNPLQPSCGFANPCLRQAGADNTGPQYQQPWTIDCRPPRICQGAFRLTIIIAVPFSNHILGQCQMLHLLIVSLKFCFMNGAHQHLLLNHLPIIIPILALLVLVSGFLYSSAVIKRVGLALFVLGALFTIPAFTTGEGAEEVVEMIPGISDQYIEVHEEVAETFAVLSYVLGALSLVALWASWKQKSFARHLVATVMVLSLPVLFFAQQSGSTGGEIRHEEIRTNAHNTVAPVNAADDDED
jgi:uncharacterized membrane protein